MAAIGTSADRNVADETEPPSGSPAGLEADDQETYTIGDLAKAFDLTHRTIRYYEDEGLISPNRKGSARVYGKADRARISLICRGKRLGFSIAEIGEFLKLYDNRDRQVGQMRFALEKARERIFFLERQLDDVRQTLGELRQIEQAILDHLGDHAHEQGRTRAVEGEGQSPGQSPGQS